MGGSSLVKQHRHKSMEAGEVVAGNGPVAIRNLLSLVTTTAGLAEIQQPGGYGNQSVPGWNPRKGLGNIAGPLYSHGNR